MSVPCEVAAKCVLPVVRAMLAKELMTKYKMKQTEAAGLLSVSQPAISLYCSKLRGKAIDLENDREVLALTNRLARSLATGKSSRKDFVLSFCEICRVIRSKGLLCDLHKTFDPSVDIENCGLCTTERLRCT